MVINEAGTSIKDIQNVLKEDGGFYLAIITLLGYLFTTIQQIVRYAYYGVELTYLLSIKLEDILLGVFYIAVISLFIVLAYELRTAKKACAKACVVLKQIVFGFVCCAFSYALTLRFAYDFFCIFAGAILFTDFIVWLLRFCKVRNWVLRIRTWFEHTSPLSKVTLAVIASIAFVVLLQFGMESYNKRFTYIIDNDKCYSVLTTFQDCYLTVESRIADDEITILRGNINLIPISGSSLNEKQFNVKILEHD